MTEVIKIRGQLNETDQETKTPLNIHKVIRHLDIPSGSTLDIPSFKGRRDTLERTTRHLSDRTPDRTPEKTPDHSPERSPSPSDISTDRHEVSLRINIPEQSETKKHKRKRTFMFGAGSPIDKIPNASEFLVEYTDVNYQLPPDFYENKITGKTSPIGKKKLKKDMSIFIFLMKMAGLLQTSSKGWKIFLRIIINSCALLCLINLFYKTTSYVSVLFDFTLISLHFWVCFSYEVWVRYVKTSTYEYLMKMFISQETSKLTKQMKILGWIGILLIPVATIFLTIGWLSPIASELIDKNDMASSMIGSYSFMVFHFGLMIIIIIPWCCVCFGSLFSFHFLLTAHKSEIMSHYNDLQAAIDRKWILRTHLKKMKPIQSRMLFTSSYFHVTYLWFIINGVLMIVTVMNKTSKGDEYKFNQIFQYIFYGILGLLSLLFGIFSISSIDSFWKNLFLHKLNYMVLNIEDSTTRMEVNTFYNSLIISYKFFTTTLTEEMALAVIGFICIISSVILIQY